MGETLVVNEIYLSLQGESTFAGLPCIFVRLSGCDLRCSYCDTAYAFTRGDKCSLLEIEEKVCRLATPFCHNTAVGRFPLVEFTGGEPLLQKNSAILMKRICDLGFTVLLETSGAHDITIVDPRVHRIVDLKCPSSGEEHRNRWENLTNLRPSDEVKCVVATQQDYEWAKAQLNNYQLTSICPVLFSWAAPLTETQQNSALRTIPAGQTRISRQQLAEQIVADALPVRFQVQIHKIIWPPDARGV